MASEITVTLSLSVTKNSVTEATGDQGLAGAQFTQSGRKVSKHEQTIGTSEEAILLGDITPPCWCYMKNNDATNYVSIRPATAAVNMIKLEPGEAWCGRMEAAAPFAIADTASVPLFVMLVDD